MFWSIAVHSLAGDYFPPPAVASVYGIAGTGSTLGSIISTSAVGRTMDLTHSYIPVFAGIGSLMPVALGVGATLMKWGRAGEGFLLFSIPKLLPGPRLCVLTLSGRDVSVEEREKDNGDADDT